MSDVNSVKWAKLKTLTLADLQAGGTTCATATAEVLSDLLTRGVVQLSLTLIQVTITCDFGLLRVAIATIIIL